MDTVRAESRYWLPTLAGDSLAWYLKLADAAVVDLYRKWGKISLVGHSAGGWLARILIGSEPYDGDLLNPPSPFLVSLGRFVCLLCVGEVVQRPPMAMCRMAAHVSEGRMG